MTAPKIDAPDVGYLTRKVYKELTKRQRETFQGAPFFPIFAIEVADISIKSKFEKLDRKIKDDYFAPESSVQLAWLIDPVNKKIHLYRRGMRRHSWGWRDIGGGQGNFNVLKDTWKNPTFESELAKTLNERTYQSDRCRIRPQRVAEKSSHRRFPFY
ncbi:7587_t:CDS:2 [Paraglomus occultum]|uniref:7587_t:CDS:1 n=1 Tax=Paraglomus occultum TaxID=144539 RepID=A0A9N9GH75_9GLOM|nr:7587_t:CDS:2 [Paraglomus occultum]